MGKRGHRSWRRHTAREVRGEQRRAGLVLRSYAGASRRRKAGHADDPSSVDPDARAGSPAPAEEPEDFEGDWASPSPPWARHTGGQTSAAGSPAPASWQSASGSEAEDSVSLRPVRRARSPAEERRAPPQGGSHSGKRRRGQLRGRLASDSRDRREASRAPTPTRDWSPGWEPRTPSPATLRGPPPGYTFTQLARERLLEARRRAGAEQRPRRRRRAGSTAGGSAAGYQ
jgi:hypothetical protein